VEATSLWLLLLLRAFASGCTAMTGIEAVSNGVSAFREPVVANAHRTLTAIVQSPRRPRTQHAWHAPAAERMVCVNTLLIQQTLTRSDCSLARAS